MNWHCCMTPSVMPPLSGPLSGGKRLVCDTRPENTSLHPLYGLTGFTLPHPFHWDPSAQQGGAKVTQTQAARRCTQEPAPGAPPPAGW